MIHYYKTKLSESRSEFQLFIENNFPLRRDLTIKELAKDCRTIEDVHLGAITSIALKVIILETVETATVKRR